MRYSKSIIGLIILIIAIIFGGKSFLSHRSNSSHTDISTTKSNIKVQEMNEPPSDSKAAVVVRVVDGDTVKIKYSNGEETSLRLLLVDTPETKHPKLGVQKYGPQASEFTKEQLKAGMHVYIEGDKESHDKYNRALGYLWYKKDGQYVMINEELVANGLARVGYVYRSKKYLNELNSLQEQAKEKKINIWSKSGYVTEKGYNMKVYAA